MSIAQEPTELLELDELLLSEDRPTNRIYGRLTSRNAPSAPTLINDIFDFSSGTDHQQPFDNGGYSVHLDFDVLQPPIAYLSMAGQRQNCLPMDNQEGQQLECARLPPCYDLCMLSDPERPSNEQYEFLSAHEKQQQPPFEVNQQTIEDKAPEDRTPTKSSSTEIEADYVAPAFCQETRQDKLKRYLEKRHSRNWNRKVSYDCRKKVADSRLRIKGRFITRSQAEQILGQSIINYTSAEVKLLLERHFTSRKELGKTGSSDFMELSSANDQIWRKASMASQPCDSEIRCESHQAQRFDG